jgi:hypothetical protein
VSARSSRPATSAGNASLRFQKMLAESVFGDDMPASSDRHASGCLHTPAPASLWKWNHLL